MSTLYPKILEYWDYERNNLYIPNNWDIVENGEFIPDNIIGKGGKYKAYLKGYYGEEVISHAEYDLLWHGATYMFISYMQCYGPDAVDSLWKILQFGLKQKEKLWEMIVCK